MAKKFPLHPVHPERICWGCDKYCPTDALGCGNGSGRTQHPAELLGDDWYEWGDWGIEAEAPRKPGRVKASAGGGFDLDLGDDGQDDLDSEFTRRGAA